MNRGLLVLMMGVCAAGCGNDSSADTTDARPRVDAGAADFRPDFAGQVRVMEGASGTAQEFFGVRAWITDKGLLPPGQFVASDGDCAVYTHPAPGTCSPSCLGEYCNASDQCEPYPSPRSAGVISVSGTKQALSFTPNAGGYDLPFVDGDLFDDGDPVTISAAGDQLAGFQVQLDGVADLQLITSSVSFQTATDQQVTWVAENSGRIQLALVTGHHLAPYETLVLCETEDDGSLTITGDLIAQVPYQMTFLESHLSTMARFRRQVVDTDVGPIEVIIGHQQGIGFSHYPPQ